MPMKETAMPFTVTVTTSPVSRSRPVAIVSTPRGGRPGSSVRGDGDGWRPGGACQQADGAVCRRPTSVRRERQAVHADGGDVRAAERQHVVDAPCVSSTRRSSSPAVRSTDTSSSPRPVFSDVTVRTPARRAWRRSGSVGARAGPDRHAVGERAVGAVGDRPGARPEMRIASATASVIARRVADQRGLVADHQRVAAGAEVDVQRAGELVQVAVEVVRAVGQAEGGARGHVDALVAGGDREVGRRRRALDVEHVVARAGGMSSVSTP